MSFPLENKTHNETGYSRLPHTMPRKNSLRLLTTPNTPVPPSLKTSPYLKSPAFNYGLASPTLPSEEDERWLQDTIPLPSRHHEQVARAWGIGQSPPSKNVDWTGSEIQLSRGAVTSGQRGSAAVVMLQKGAVPSPPPHHHHRRHLSACESSRLRRLEITIPNPRTSSNFVPPSLAWRSAGLCRRRWSTGPLRPPNPEQDIYHFEKLIR